MTKMLASPASLSDAALVTQVKALAARERLATTELIATLAEFDLRRLYLGAGCSSLFTYCTRVLHPKLPKAAASAVTKTTVERILDDVLHWSGGRPGPIFHEIAQPSVESTSPMMAPPSTDGMSEAPDTTANPTAE